MGNGYMRPYDMSQDPYLAQGINSIAKMFAPPSAQDVLAGAKVQELRRQQQAIGALPEPVRNWIAAGAGAKDYTTYDLYQRSLQPGATVESLDAPVYALHGNAANTMAGLKQQERTKMGTALVAPIPKDAVRQLPPQVAQEWGLPQTQFGNVEVAAGGKSVLPDGRTIMGQPTVDSVKAGVLQSAVSGGGAAGASFNDPVIRSIMGLPMTATEQAADYARRVKGTPDEELARRAAISAATPAGVDPFRAQAEAASEASKNAVKQADEVLKAGAAAKQAQARIRAMLKLNEMGDLPAGPLANFNVETRQLLQEAGYPVDPNGLANAELYRSLAQKFIFDNAAALKPVSNIDLAGLEKAAPALLASPAGRKAILEYMLSENERAAAAGDFTTNYIGDPTRRGVADAMYPVEMSKAMAARPAAQLPVVGDGPVRVNSPDEAAKLPSGTKFVTPDGRVKVRP